MTSGFRALLCLVLLAGLCGCGSDAMIIGAASSLTEAFREIEVEYEKTASLEIDVEFASSGVLEAQIRAGAPIAIFAAAGAQEPLDLYDSGLAGTPIEFARNRMIVATRAGLPAIQELSDLENPQYGRIAIGAPATVPSGRYAMEILSDSGIYESVLARLLPCTNVRQALAYLERGDVDAAFLYRTDLELSRASLNHFLIPDSLHSPIRYLVCITQHGDAEISSHAYVRYLISEEGQSILQEHGFEAPIESLN